MSNSPFPGMDPYLEGELWQEFHDSLVGYHRLLNYNQSPPPPPLDAETAAWVERTKLAAGQLPP
jgi:hypothetical protein